MKKSLRKYLSIYVKDRWDNGSAGKPKRSSIGKRKWESRVFTRNKQSDD